MRINARLSEEETQQLAEVRARTGQTVSEVVRHALRGYYEAIRGEGVSARRAILESGLVGCGEADPDLSSSYKDALRGLGRKHGDR
jgi:hypothetical protein